MNKIDQMVEDLVRPARDLMRFYIGLQTFHEGRICKFCGINMDIPFIDILEFFHGECWKQYRRNGLIYPMPKYA